MLWVEIRCEKPGAVCMPLCLERNLLTGERDTLHHLPRLHAGLHADQRGRKRDGEESGGPNQGHSLNFVLTARAPRGCLQEVTEMSL